MIKLTISFLFILLVSAPLWGAELVKVNSQESKEFEDSAFIKLMNNLNGGKIPYPFANLLDSFGTGVRETGSVILIPKGRSLVKEFADYQNPRIIVEPVSNDSKKNYKHTELVKKLGVKEGDIFIGFAPNHNALEVISYNSKLGRYDFFVIEDYQKGKTPKVISNPALCLSCHQNKAPLFSKFPWAESLGETGQKIQQQTPTDRDVSKVMNEILKANGTRREIEGIKLDPLRFNANLTAGFDGSVRRSNEALFKHKVCESLCARGVSDVSCQEKLLLAGDSEEKNFSQTGLFKGSVKKIQGMDLKSELIEDRNPLTGDILLTGLKNPTAPREKNQSLASLQRELESAKTFNEKIQLLYQQCVSKEDLAITPALLKNKSIVQELKKWPDTRDLIEVIKRESKKVSPVVSKDEINCLNDQTVVAPILPVYKYADLTDAANVLMDEKISKPLASFKKYCMQCHGGSSSFIELPLDSLEKLAAYQPSFSDTGILERLEKKIMPPAFADLPLPDAERKKMIEAIKELQKSL